MRCRTHDVAMHMIPCPDATPGCLVAHFACPQCVKARSERETLEALQQANGVAPISGRSER